MSWGKKRKQQQMGWTNKHPKMTSLGVSHNMEETSGDASDEY
jgi:hypothetical protein